MSKLDKDQLEKISGGVKNESLTATKGSGEVHRVSLVDTDQIAELDSDGPSLQKNEEVHGKK